MVKQAETLELKPAPAQQSNITITVKVLVPVIAYGNIELQATQEIDVSGVPDMRERYNLQQANMDELRKTLAQSVLPLVEAEVARYASILLKEANPSYWMSKNSSVYQWFRIANPDVEIPAMQAILDSKSIPNSAQE